MRHRKLVPVAVSLLLGASGCSSGSSSHPETISVSANSSALAVFVGPSTCSETGLPYGSASVAALSILIFANTSLPDVCVALSDGCTGYASTKTIFLDIENFDAAESAASSVGLGTYRLTQSINNELTGTVAGAAVSDTNASCNTADTTSGDSSTGTITITSITSNAVTGSFDVVVNGSEYQGAIDATICPASDYAVSWTGCAFDITSNTCSGTPQCVVPTPAAG